LSRFQTVPVNVAGPSYHDRSRPLSSQETRNFYHELLHSGKEQYVIKSFPGQTYLANAGAGADRGSHVMANVPYRVVGTTLYSVTSGWVYTAIGSIPGTERCIFADDGTDMFIACGGGVVKQYTPSTGTLSTVTDTNITGAKSVAYLNNQFLYTFDHLTVVSNVSDGATANGLNAIDEESSPDLLIRDYVFQQVIYRFGETSCPSWWNPVTASVPPIERIDGQVLGAGLAAIHAVTSSRDWIYFVGTDKQIYQARGAQLNQFSSAALAGAIQDYSDISDCWASTFTLDNKTMILFSFPTAGHTWCTSEELGIDGWFELSAGVGTNEYNAGSIVEAYGKVLIGASSGGNLYHLDFTSYDQGGATWQRRRVLGSINGDALGAKGYRVEMSRMEFIMETGTGLITGQGSDPKIMIEASYDGGRTWTTGQWLRIGRLGEYTLRAEWYNMRSFTDMMVRLTITDPVACNIYAAAIDLRVLPR
jgi:hypothetical protein